MARWLGGGRWLGLWLGGGRWLGLWLGGYVPR